MQPEGGGPNDPLVWLRYARSDLFIAQNKLQSSLLENHCYHAQQSVEKCLKAVCIHLEIKFPYTHDLAELSEVLFKGSQEPPEWVQQAKQLTSYATSGRYPGFDEPVTEEEWTDAIRIAKLVFDWAISLIQKS
jgi:HEPN domain-containing protein